LKPEIEGVDEHLEECKKKIGELPAIEKEEMLQKIGDLEKEIENEEGVRNESGDGEPFPKQKDEDEKDSS
jgi:hypothetical protein